MQSECLILLKSRKVGAEQQFAKCSIEDFDFLNKLSWFVGQDGYVKTTSIIMGEMLMHRIVCKLQGLELASFSGIVDHIYGDKLDNRRECLRITTRGQNSQNKRKRPNSSSSFHGVFVSKKRNKFEAKIQIHGKQIHIGSFDTEEKAAIAYDKYLISRPDFKNLMYNLNYPDNVEQTKQAVIPLKHHKILLYNNVFENKGEFYARLLHKKQRLLYKKFNTAIDAAKAVDACIVHYKLCNPLNFPDDYPNYRGEKEIITLKENTENPEIVRVFLKNDTDTKIYIDAASYESIKYHRLSHSKRNGYINVKVDSKLYRLHRFLFNEKDETILIDHIDNNPLNNVMSNLRRATHKQNSQNRKRLLKNKSSIYAGVVYLKERRKFSARIGSLNSSFKYTKSHDSEIDAARDRDLTIMANIPDHCFKMNFIWTPEEIEFWKLKLKK